VNRSFVARGQHLLNVIRLLPSSFGMCVLLDVCVSFQQNGVLLIALKVARPVEYVRYKKKL
jgi:hypothetical protein